VNDELKAAFDRYEEALMTGDVAGQMIPVRQATGGACARGAPGTDHALLGAALAAAGS